MESDSITSAKPWRPTLRAARAIAAVEGLGEAIASSDHVGEVTTLIGGKGCDGEPHRRGARIDLEKIEGQGNRARALLPLRG